MTNGLLFTIYYLHLGPFIPGGNLSLLILLLGFFAILFLFVYNKKASLKYKLWQGEKSEKIKIEI